MTVEIPLTQGRSCVVDEVDADWALAQRWCVTNGYPARGVWSPRRRSLYMHREIAVRAGALTIYDDPLFVDHVNRQPFDNRRANLRAVTLAENNCNRTPGGVTGVLGIIEYRPGRWGAEIKRNGKRARKYGFDSSAEAAAWRERQIAELGARI